MKYSASSVWENKDRYGIAVIGAGHAGCEAALAAARLGVRTIMFTVSVQTLEEVRKVTLSKRWMHLEERWER